MAAEYRADGGIVLGSDTGYCIKKNENFDGKILLSVLADRELFIIVNKNFAFILDLDAA